MPPTGDPNERLPKLLAEREARLFAFCESPRRAPGLVLLALLLSSSALWLDLYLDDAMVVYLHSDLPGAAELSRMYSGGFGLSTDRADNLWQMEHGYAPWWTYEHLHTAFFRPISLATHQLDAAVWHGNAALMHAHSLVWLGLLVLAATFMYRRAHAPLLGGMAALLFAIDHTHGFEVGFVTNRHVLVTGALGALALGSHLRARSEAHAASAWLGPVFYALALLGGESAVAVCGYLFAHALLVERTSLWRRAASIAPYVVITLVWRVAYVLAGYGARGSGVYVDPVTDTVAFLRALAVRGPVLLQASFTPVPADLFTISSASAMPAWWLSSVAACALVGLAAWPLLVRDRMARFWACGMLLSLVPAGATLASNRQLLFASFGAVALVAQLWHLHAVEQRGRLLAGAPRVAAGVATCLLFVRLAMSPVMLPVTTCSIAFTTRWHRSHEGVGDEVAGKDLVIVTAPDDMTVRLAQLSRRIDGSPLPRRIRMLSLGPHRVTATSRDVHTLELVYEGGILQDAFSEIFRDRRLAMKVGERVRLAGLDIEVLGVTSDGRAQRASFRFDRPLADPSLVFYAWQNERLRPWQPPPLGHTMQLEAATLRWGLQ